MLNSVLSSRCNITTHDLGGGFSIPRCSNASEGLGAVAVCDIVEIRVNICFHYELMDLQKHRMCVTVSVLPQDIQQVVGCPGKSLEMR